MSHADAGSARVDRVDPIEVVTIGETMVQLVPKGERLQDAAFLHVGIGGAESNLASYLAAAGRAVSWVSAVGDDPLGRRMLEDIASYGVDVSGVRVDRYAPTGIYFKDPDVVLGADSLPLRAGHRTDGLVGQGMI